MKLQFYFLSLIALALLSACQAEEPNPQPGKRDTPSALLQLQLDRSSSKTDTSAGIALSIIPEPLTSAAQAEALLRNCNEETGYQWAVNGRELVGQTTDTLERSAYQRDDTITLNASCGNVTLAAETVVQNSPPTISAVKFEDPALAAGKDLRVIPVAIDMDEDLIDFTYEWEIDGTYREEITGPTLAGELLKKGTEVFLAVTPHDGISSGETFQGLSLAIPNSPPVITSEPPPLTSMQYIYQVTASDPDGTILTYRLNKGPEGMSIDTASGLLSWDIDPDTPIGTYDIEFAAEDDEGAQARQFFSLSLSNPEQ